MMLKMAVFAPIPTPTSGLQSVQNREPGSGREGHIEHPGRECPLPLLKQAFRRPASRMVRHAKVAPADLGQSTGDITRTAIQDPFYAGPTVTFQNSCNPIALKSASRHLQSI